VATHCGLLACTLDRGGGCPGVCVGCIEVTGLTLYHPHVASDGGVRFPQLGAKSLNLVLSDQQTSALHPSCLLCHGPLVVAHQLASPEPLGSQEPLALSRRVPLLVLILVVCRAGILEIAARSEVPAD
jgi:hypothetical protein